MTQEQGRPTPVQHPVYSSVQTCSNCGCLWEDRSEWCSDDYCHCGHDDDGEAVEAWLTGLNRAAQVLSETVR